MTRAANTITRSGRRRSDAGMKARAAMANQCPAPGHPVPGTCTMHASSDDLSVLLAALGKAADPPTAPIFLPTPNHSHVVFSSRVASTGATMHRRADAIAAADVQCVRRLRHRETRSGFFRQRRQVFGEIAFPERWHAGCSAICSLRAGVARELRLRLLRARRPAARDVREHDTNLLVG